jgi:hypothetical protein
MRTWDSAWNERTSDAADQYQELTLYEEWRDFPHGRHDDRLDGLDVLARLTREYAVLGDREVAIEVLSD